MQPALQVTAVFVTLIVVMGASASGEWARDEVDANLEEGHDTATGVENRLHGGHSHVGGIYGYIEFKTNTRLTQSINHYLRCRLFERIKALSMTTLEDQRIGAASAGSRSSQRQARRSWGAPPRSGLVDRPIVGFGHGRRSAAVSNACAPPWPTCVPGRRM